MSALVTAAAVTVGGGLIAANQAKQAAKGQANAAKQANQLAASEYEQNRLDQTPWREAGGAAVGRLSTLLGLSGQGTEGYGALNQQFNYDQNTDPGTQFRIAMANKALERSAAAKGNLMSGGTLKALAGYNQDMASQEYQNAYGRWKANQDTTYNRLANLAGLGQTSVQATGQAGQNYAQMFGQNTMGAANANAAAGIAGANAIIGGFNTGISNWLKYGGGNRSGSGGSGAGSTGMSFYDMMKLG